jgi:hypothetical protein
MKNIKVPSFKERRKKMEVIADIDKQLVAAKKVCSRLKNLSKGNVSLEEKMAYSKKEDQARAVLREIRKSVFDIEDEINNLKAA